MRKWLFYFLWLLIIVSCRQSKYPGFTLSPSGYYYKLHTIGDSDSNINNSDYVTVSFEIIDSAGNVLSPLNIQSFIVDSSNNGILMSLITNLSVGDSATFIIEGTDSSTNNPINQHVNLKVNSRLSDYELKKMKEYLTWKQDMEMNEQIILNEYVSNNKLEERFFYGIYFIPIKEGRGKLPEAGETIYINYVGWFLDGTEFDNTYKSAEPLEMKIGDPDQVIKGFEIAISTMKRGGKAKIIIPSQFAFGESGSSTGIVPPFTTVIYEIEILNKYKS
jgi:FKBP-type peptidyl-prolyl cis-trans isomerase FkpA